MHLSSSSMLCAPDPSGLKSRRMTPGWLLLKKTARDLKSHAVGTIRFDRVYGSLKFTVIWVSTSTGSPFR
jgi:hypothetical protein